MDSQESLHQVLAVPPAAFSTAGEEAMRFVARLFPICRSITGNGLRQTLRMIGERIPLQFTEVPSGRHVYDWQVPREWNVREAYIADATGRRIVDFADNNLHLMNYSVPVSRRMSLEELQPHLHSLPEHPDWIPYRTSYYRDNWGFCLRHSQRESLPPGEYEVHIDSSLSANGSLTYAECVIPGDSEREFLVFTHCCHPSTCNDNLTGIAVAMAIADWLRPRRHRLTYRFVFAPATIGSIAWLADHEQHVGCIDHGLVLGLLGDAACLSYKNSRREDRPIDRIGAYVMNRLVTGGRVRRFSPYGYDERQFCSPGFDLPVGRLTRSSNGEYPEYHTSADNAGLITAGALAESTWAILQVLAIADSNRRYRNRSPKCEPRLGKHGLYGATGGAGPSAFEHALLWVLNQSDGNHDLLDIAIRADANYATILQGASALEGAGLIDAV